MERESKVRAFDVGVAERGNHVRGAGAHIRVCNSILKIKASGRVEKLLLTPSYSSSIFGRFRPGLVKTFNMSATTTADGPLITVPYDECTLDTCPISIAQLPYDPNLAGNLLYLVIFALCLFINLALGIWYRTWGYLVAMSFACLLEILGYVGRLQMHCNPFPHNPFLM